MKMRCICFWQHQFTSELMGIEETPYGVCCHCDKTGHLGKKLLLLGLIDSLLYKLDMQDPQERDQ